MTRSGLRFALLLVATIGVPDRSVSAERSFRLGFTPFPYDITVEAIDWTYHTVLSHGDLIAHHLDNGVPWPEALGKRELPQLVENQLSDRVRRTPSEHPIYLAATPLSQLRDGLAEYWNNEGAIPPPGPWAGRSFNHKKVVRAYTNYCQDLIARFSPDYFAYAVEVDILARNDPAAFEDFKKLARKIYRRLKRSHPDIPIFLTFTLGHPGDWDLIKSIMQPLLPFTDMLAISTYPYLVVDYGGKPSRIPDDWFSQIRELHAVKPIAVAETGYAAETLVLESFDITIPGRPRWQRAYAKRLLEDAQDLEMEFVIWFTSVDYDRIWDLMAAAGVSELFKAWRDTGMYDQDLRRRPAARVWDRFRRLSLNR